MASATTETSVPSVRSADSEGTKKLTAVAVMRREFSSGSAGPGDVLLAPFSARTR